MPDHFDARETRDPAAREADLLQRLPGLIDAALAGPGWRQHLGAIDARAITSRAALARLPVLRKPNSYQTWQKFDESWIMSKMSYGNAYVLKEDDARRVVTGMHVLDPQRVRPLVTAC
jgi:hypothetical protein